MLNLPVDIHKQIIPFLNYDVRTLCSFAIVSKAAGDIFRQIAQSNGDINLAGERVPFLCNKGTKLKACIFQILKLHVLEIHPELRETLTEVREEVAFSGEDPNNIDSLYKHVLNYAGGFTTLPSVRKFITAIIPFDFQTRKIGDAKKIRDQEGFAFALFDAIVEKKIVLAQLIIGHPGSKWTEGANLGRVISAAANMDNYELIQLTRSHPHANTCPVVNISRALSAAVGHNNYEMTKIVLSFRNAANIPADRGPDNNLNCLQHTLSTAILHQNPKLIRKIISHPNAKHMSLVDQDGGLIVTLKQAFKTKNRRVIAAVLSHPKIIQLSEQALYKAGTALVGPEDVQLFHVMKRMLEEGKPNQLKLKDLGKAFSCMSYELQCFFYVMLCKTHGCPTDNIKKEGMVHLIKHPHSLLPIMKKLTAACWDVATPGDNN